MRSHDGGAPKAMSSRVFPNPNLRRMPSTETWALPKQLSFISFICYVGLVGHLLVPLLVMLMPTPLVIQSTLRELHF